MKVGDYVRTEWGDIEKIIKIDKENIIVNIEEDEEGRTYCKMCYKNEIKKSSPNIIDLIEVGDYVNGQKVFDKLYDEGNVCWYLKLEIGEVFGKYARTYEQHIKSTVTKEQFEAMEYKVEV